MELIPGFIQGIVRVLVSYPFDYIRTNIQSNQYKSANEFIKSVNLSPRKIYNGVSVPLCTVPIDRALNFYIFEECKKRQLSSIYSSLVSTSLCSIYFVPLNYFSTKVVLSNTSVRDVWSSFKHLKKTQFFRGFIPDITRNFLGSMLFMTTYGTLRDKIHKDNHNYVLFGVVSSVNSWIFTYPLDTIRILKQKGNETYPQLIMGNYKNLYKGFSYILMRSMPSAGIGMFAYEYTKQALRLS
jgi:hypothetical protein